MQEGISKANIVTRKLRPSDKCEKSNAIYLEVIQKNFQTINDLLKKLNTILSKHQQFEYEIANYAKRLSKIQGEIQSIHNQHRRDNLHIYSSIQNLKQQLNGIDTHIQILYSDYRKKGLLSIIKNKEAIRDSEPSERDLTSQAEVDAQSQSLLQQNPRNSSYNTIISSYKIKDEIHKSDSINQKTQQTGQRGQLDGNKTFSKISDNMISSYQLSSAMAQTQNVKRKLSKHKKGANRQSLQVKMQAKNIRSFIEEAFLERDRSEIGSKKSTRKSVQCPPIKQISNASSIKNESVHQTIVKKQKEKIESIRASILSQNKSESSNIFDFVAAQFAKADPNNQKITTTQFQTYLKTCLADEKHDQIDKKIYDIALKSMKTEQDMKSLYLSVVDINQRCNFFVTSQKLADEIFNLFKQINKLKEYCRENFANKNQTKKAILFMDTKIKNTANVVEIKENFQEFGLIISKCLSCNRTFNVENDTPTIGRSLSQCRTSESSGQRKISVSELKKKTIQIMKKGKIRIFEKN